MSVDNSRRNMLRFGLAGVAGMVAGHSLLKSKAFAAETTLQVAIPRLSASAGTLSSTSRTQALEALAPVLTGLTQAAGISLSNTQISALKSNLLSRGALQLPAGTMESAYTISTLSLKSSLGIR